MNRPTHSEPSVHVLTHECVVATCAGCARDFGDGDDGPGAVHFNTTHKALDALRDANWTVLGDRALCPFSPPANCAQPTVAAGAPGISATAPARSPTTHRAAAATAPAPSVSPTKRETGSAFCPRRAAGDRARPATRPSPR